MLNNTVSKIATRFLRGVELVDQLNKKWEIQYENWSYPHMTYGDPDDPYYAEIWENGMDYNIVFYLLENINYEIKTNILMFADNKEWQKLERTGEDKEILQAILYMRRDKLWIKKNDYGAYSDTFLPYIHFENKKPYYEQVTDMKWAKIMHEAFFEHASQPRAKFLVNKDLFYNERKEKLNKIKKINKEILTLKIYPNENK